jgi:hypothetical protein
VTTYEFHELALLFPTIEGKDFDELVADIKANGLREPLTLLDGEILDGKNRARACEVAGVEPTFKTYEGDDPVGFVVSANLLRRHLTPGQCSALAVELASRKHGGDRRSEDFKVSTEILKDDPPPLSLEEAVEKVPGATLGTARRLSAVKAADPAVFEDVKAGTITAGAAEAKVKTATEQRIDDHAALARLLRKARAEQPDDEAFFAFAKTLPGRPGKAECAALVNLGGLDDRTLRSVLARYGRSSKPFAETWRDYENQKRRDYEQQRSRRQAAADRSQARGKPVLRRQDRGREARLRQSRNAAEMDRAV